MVSDVTRMWEWSPETTGARWVGGASGPVPGARFRGTNKRGFRRWQTTCTVTEAEPGRSFVFDVSFAVIPISTWGYRVEPAGEDACTVTEWWDDRRPSVFTALAGPVMGTSDQAAHNRGQIEATLERLAAAAERAPAAG